ncbi:hypothetical protein ACMD2_09162, partial [Ananas comosus]
DETISLLKSIHKKSPNSRDSDHETDNHPDGRQPASDGLSRFQVVSGKLLTVMTTPPPGFWPKVRPRGLSTSTSMLFDAPAVLALISSPPLLLVPTAAAEPLQLPLLFNPCTDESTHFLSASDTPRNARDENDCNAKQGLKLKFRLTGGGGGGDGGDLSLENEDEDAAAAEERVEAAAAAAMVEEESV